MVIPAKLASAKCIAVFFFFVHCFFFIYYLFVCWFFCFLIVFKWSIVMAVLT